MSGVVWFCLGEDEGREIILGTVISETKNHAWQLAAGRYPGTSRVMSAASYAIAQDELAASERSGIRKPAA